VSAEAFQSIAGWIDYPMFIVTTVGGGERSGCLVGFAHQVSIDPVRFLACISVTNHTYGVAARASALAVHVIPDDREDLAEVFGGETDDAADKFEEVGWRPGPEDLPILVGCPSWFAGTILDRIPFGDHVGYLLEPFAGEDGLQGSFLPFSSAKSIHPGHAP
jgi:flavin reductase (DIM6/NTAB) family NADH-FMN oxidoreductase RutF